MFEDHAAAIVIIKYNVGDFRAPFVGCVRRLAASTVIDLGVQMVTFRH